MAGTKFLLCLLAVGAPLAECQDNDTNVTKEAGGMAVKFRGKSGKFTIFNKDMDETDKNKITFEIQELRETDADGNEIGKKANPKHQLKDFKKTEFNFTFAEDVAVGTSSASVVSFSSIIEDVGVLKVDTYLIQQSGVVGPNLTNPDSPQWDTFAGDVKFNVELSEWKWCGDGSTCVDKGKNELGAFIDLDIEVKGPKSKPERKGKAGGGGKAKAYDLGGGIDLDLTSDVDIDGENASMPAGYPMMVSRGSKQVFTFRFPKFSNRTVYDPLLGTSASESLGTTTTSTDGPAMGTRSQIETSFLMLMSILACSVSASVV